MAEIAHRAELKNTVSIDAIIYRANSAKEAMRVFREQITNEWVSTGSGLDTGSGPPSKIYCPVTTYTRRTL